MDRNISSIRLPTIAGKRRESLRQLRRDLCPLLIISIVLHGNIKKLRAPRMGDAFLLRQSIRERCTQKSLPAAFNRKKAGEKSNTEDKKKSESHKKPRIDD